LHKDYKKIHNQYTENTKQIHKTTKALAIISKMCIMFYIRNAKKCKMITIGGEKE